jgi:large subunit ribosomal protein L23
VSVKDPYRVLIKPIITEKSTWLKDINRDVCFEVERRANKIEVKEAVEKLFDVKVESVRIVKKKGKTKRVGKNIGRTKDWKKAYVKLKQGEKMIEYFEAV